MCVSVKYRRPNGWNDHDQIWHAYADRSENGSYLKKIDPTTTQGTFWGVYGVKKVTNLGKIPNHWTDRDQIWHTYADSSRNGCRLKKCNPSRHQGAFIGGHKFKNVGKTINIWTDRNQIRHTYADSSGNGHRLNKLTGSRPQGAFGRGLRGHKFKNVG